MYELMMAILFLYESDFSFIYAKIDWMLLIVYPNTIETTRTIRITKICSASLVFEGVAFICTWITGVISPYPMVRVVMVLQYSE